MPINAGIMSSATPEWATPKALFDSLSLEFGPFDLDVCATPENAKVARFFSKEQDGLAQPWEGVCWMNPPYGREIGHWVKKARTCGTRVVCLLPARTDTAWWHDNIPHAQLVRFLRGRVHFNDQGPAPFPSAVVVFDADPDLAAGSWVQDRRDTYDDGDQHVAASSIEAGVDL